MPLTFGDAEGLGKHKRTRREIFLAEMEQVVPWKSLLSLIEPYYPRMGRPGRLLEAHGLAKQIFERVNAHLARKGQSLRAGTIMDATIIAAPSSIKNQGGGRDPQMRQTKKGNQWWYFGMKAHIGVDGASGLVHHVACTGVNEADVTQVHKLLHDREDTVCGDSGYTGADKRKELQEVRAGFLIAEKPSKLRAIRNKRERHYVARWERCKASLRAKVEHPFRVI